MKVRVVNTPYLSFSSIGCSYHRKCAILIVTHGGYKTQKERVSTLVLCLPFHLYTQKSDFHKTSQESSVDIRVFFRCCCGKAQYITPLLWNPLDPPPYPNKKHAFLPCLLYKCKTSMDQGDRWGGGYCDLSTLKDAHMLRCEFSKKKKTFIELGWLNVLFHWSWWSVCALYSSTNTTNTIETLMRTRVLYHS